MSVATTPWNVPTPIKGDEYQIWFHNDKGRLCRSREKALDYVSHLQFKSVTLKQADLVYTDLTQEFLEDWIGQQPNYLSPDHIPQAVKFHVTNWQKINNAKPDRFFKKPKASIVGGSTAINPEGTSS